ncbi:MAG: transcriptional regulator, partial [Moorea sp. SIO4A5]|nr:transcriptional regulator [Moorena sp. SIO4A5]
RDSGEVLAKLGKLPSSRILALAPNTGNKLWIGTSEGLAWVSMTTGRIEPHLGFVREIPGSF